MRRAANGNGPRLRSWQEWTVYGVLAVLTLSGCAWLLLHTFAAAEGEFGPSAHPAERPLLVVHGVTSFVMLMLAGLLLERHVPAAWRQRRNLTTGIALLSGLAVAAVTAAGLYYVADERLRAWASLVHWAAGLLATAVLAVHATARNGRNGRTKRQSVQARPKRSIRAKAPEGPQLPAA